LPAPKKARIFSQKVLGFGAGREARGPEGRVLLLPRPPRRPRREPRERFREGLVSDVFMALGHARQRS
jgi:hypothetical protein